MLLVAEGSTQHLCALFFRPSQVAETLRARFGVLEFRNTSAGIHRVIIPTLFDAPQPAKDAPLSLILGFRYDFENLFAIRITGSVSPFSIGTSIRSTSL